MIVIMRNIHLNWWNGLVKRKLRQSYMDIMHSYKANAARFLENGLLCSAFLAWTCFILGWRITNKQSSPTYSHWSFTRPVFSTARNEFMVISSHNSSERVCLWISISLFFILSPLCSFQAGCSEAQPEEPGRSANELQAVSWDFLKNLS